MMLREVSGTWYKVQGKKKGSPEANLFLSSIQYPVSSIQSIE